MAIKLDRIKIFTGTTTLLVMAKKTVVTRMLTRDLFAVANFLVNVQRCLTFISVSVFPIVTSCLRCAPPVAGA